MKKGWVKSHFGDVCHYRKNNGTHKDLRYIGLEHIEQGNGQLLGTLDSNSVLSTSFRFQKGDVLYGRLRPYLKKAYVAEFDGCCSTEIFPIHSECINPSFLKYWFLSDKTTQAINETCSGCRMPRGNMNEVLKFDFCYPPLSEQQEIVEYLDSSFAKIDALKANAAKNLEEAKSLFQSALKGALEPKEGWEEKKLSEIVDSNTPISYGIVQPGEDTPNGIPVVRPVDLIEKYISLNDNIKRTSKENSESYKRTILNGKEILMCVRGTTGIVSLSDESLKNCNVTRGIVPLKISDDTKRLFVYYTLIAPIASDFIQHKTKGAALKQINIADVKMIPINLPTYQEQQSIVSHLDSLNEKVNTLQQNYSRICDECDALKQAILRQVFE